MVTVCISKFGEKIEHGWRVKISVYIWSDGYIRRQGQIQNHMDHHAITMDGMTDMFPL